MSDTRRRRKSNQSCGSDDLSDSYEELNATKETQSSEQTDGHQDSECDIYVSDSEAESQDGALRESGDGQEEEKPQKKLDDDEDRRNPQYIPKRGTFYEHDDRTADEVTDNNAEPQPERETKEKKVWKDKEDKWDHDRYNDEEQAPKSHEELIAVYGYDIRNEEGPPRARRRRRYGRGPNKYTRNWEDEDAYGKPGTNVTGRTNRRFNRSGEDFPALGTNKNASSPPIEEPVISSAWYSSKNKTPNKIQNFPPLQSQSDSPKTKSSSASNVHTNENKAPNEPTNPAWKKDTKQTNSQNSNGNSGPGGDAEKLVNVKTSPRDSNKRNVQESVSLAASRARGRGFRMNTNNNMAANRPTETKPKGRGPGPIAMENKRNSAVHNEDDQQISHDTKQAGVNDGGQYHQSGRHNKNFYGQSPNQQRSTTVPPRMQQQSHAQQQPSQQQQSPQQPNIQQQDSSGNRPKRYSSLRQRPTIPDTPGQQNYPAQHGQHSQHGQHGQHNQHNQHGQHGYFPPQAGNSRGVLESQGYPPGHFDQSPPVAATPIAGQPVIPLPPNGQPASFAPPPFLVPPPQFITPQTAPPSIINYVPGPNGPAFQNFQGYQGYSPPVQPQRPPPPQELFQPQGCTYYSPAQQQQQQQQSAPQRRPKAAIPILPPPDAHQGRGRGRTQQQPSQLGNPQGEEVKNEVPEQFDNAETEQEDSVTSVETDNMVTPVDLEVVTDLIDGISVNETQEIMMDESLIEKSIPAVVTKTENELNIVESTPITNATVIAAAAAAAVAATTPTTTAADTAAPTTSETSIVEEAAA